MSTIKFLKCAYTFGVNSVICHRYLSVSPQTVSYSHMHES